MKLKFLVTFLFTVFTMFVWAVPQLMNYQGILQDDNYLAVPDGNYTVTFTIFETQSGGSPYWSETHNITTANGVFKVLLGSINSINSFPQNAYLSIQVGNNPEMLPRKRFASVAYAFSSQTAQFANQAETSNSANTLQGHTSADFLLADDYAGTFSALAAPIELNIAQSNVWYEVRTLTVTVDSPMNLRCHGFLRRGTVGGPFAAQIMLKNSNGQILDYGSRSWRNPANINAYMDSEITYTVNPGTYVIALYASFQGEPGTVVDCYLELMGFPQSTRSARVTYDAPETQTLYPYTNGPIGQP